MNLSTADIFHKLNYESEDRIVLKGDILRMYQLTLLSIATDIKEVCESENIMYSLSGGTCLGAVRHKGFIPWDDDIDLNILGADFDRFLVAFAKKYPDKYWIHKWGKPGYGKPMCQIRLKGTVFRGELDEKKDECGFFVDLFPIVNVYDNPLLRQIHGFFCMAMGLILSCRNYYEMRNIVRKMLKENPKVAKVFKVKIFIGWCLSFLSVSRWATLTAKVYSFCKNNHSKMVTIPSGRKHYFEEMHRREDITETQPALFEGILMQVPKNYDAYLTHLYGDYMKLPPESDREYHIVFELKFPDDV